MFGNKRRDQEIEQLRQRLLESEEAFRRRFTKECEQLAERIRFEAEERIKEAEAFKEQIREMNLQLQALRSGEQLERDQLEQALEGQKELAAEQIKKDRKREQGHGISIDL